MMRIAIGSDHRGVQLKAKIVELLLSIAHVPEAGRACVCGICTAAIGCSWLLEW